ncbi:DUF3631 domain-containing protein [Arthrobacter sp. NyZ413]|uniref:DUF3631 domain-containing protein n=1 Tax=Arthrobacter sp. NyZ413 TaxID=3144669 RepID=UPI003BF8E390
MNNKFAPLAEDEYMPADPFHRVYPVGSSVQSVPSVPSGTPATEPVAAVLRDLRAQFQRYVAVMDDLDLDLLTLWTFHTHLAFETYSTPRLQLDSTMPGSGKTTVLEHLARYCLNPIQAASLSSPALLTRMLNNGLRTILIDEVDRSLDPKKDGVGELIAVLNSGYKRGATRPVLVPDKGGDWKVAEMSTFSPVAMAGNAPALPDDTKSRCIRVLLMPDLYGVVESSDWEEIEEDAQALAARISDAADSVRDFVKTVRPELPEGCIGRIKERWNPLKRVAAAASAEWEAVADKLIIRDIAEVEMDKEDGLTNLPPAVILLQDIAQIWGADRVFVASTIIVDELVEYNPGMWGQFSAYGKVLSVQRFGRMLVQAFKIHSTRQGDSKRGYFRHQFDVAFRRMGLTPPPGTDATDGTDEPTAFGGIR